VVVLTLGQAVVPRQAQVAVVTTARAAVAPINGTDPAHIANNWVSINLKPEAIGSRLINN
jgi:hypothetical protein